MRGRSLDLPPARREHENAADTAHGSLGADQLCVHAGAKSWGNADQLLLHGSPAAQMQVTQLQTQQQDFTMAAP